MEWEQIIERNREALRRVLAMLCAMACIGEHGSDGQFALSPHKGGAERFAPAESGKPFPALALPRLARRAVLRLLRPAESAARRLIVIAAREVRVTLSPPRPRKARTGHSAYLSGRTGTGIVLPRGFKPPGNRTRSSVPDFALLDPLKQHGAPRAPRARSVPRIVSFGPGAPLPAPLRKPFRPGDPLDCRRLGERIRALSTVLDDLPRAALRFARWRVLRARDRARALARTAKTRPRRSSPLRPGRPPGQLKSPAVRGEVHDILSDLHYFAVEALERPDTS